MPETSLSKIANLVVIGGPVSVGKSTLVSSLGLPAVQELSANDQLESLLLTLLYEKTRVPHEVVETYFLLKRREIYAVAAKSDVLQILDRSLFESLWFAKHTLSKESYSAFKKLWDVTVKQLVVDFGAPKLYVLLTCNWATFKERLYLRGREFEILNFQQNEMYWRAHIEEYEVWMQKVFIELNFKYEIISTDGLSVDAVLSKTLDLLERHQIISRN